MADSPFSHASLSAALATVPTDKRGCLLVVADRSGTTATVAARVGDHWQVAAEVGKPWDGPVNGKFTIMGSW